MSSLKLYAPVELSDEDDFEIPSIIPFQMLVGETPASSIMISRDSTPGNVHRLTPLLRARALHTNRVCPYCRHAAVEPIELNDGTLNRQRQPIPGTATLVGFHCQDCNAEWPAR
ncbi:MAG: hypothetical protein O2955_12900 [Planctomycetota bacterium]|nr:hypothetical protein [Planctomycetota bacterium]MDA1213407.1 hypothetical protein [Planctomycetota bacterium]